MGARQKLNEAYVNGALVVGGIAGLLTGSWTIFFITSAALIGVSTYSGGIRAKPGSYRSHRR